VQVETKGHLWHLRYPIEGKVFDPEDKSTYIVVATTRPETMLGDTAVAVHPDDDRYKALVGKNVILPLVGRKIPIIADGYSDPEKGSGAVKITPAHDFNDFEVGKRHSLQMVNVLTIEAKITFEDIAFRRPGGTDTNFLETKNLEGKSREDARKQIVVRLEEKGLIEKIEPHSNAVPHGDRSNVVIEPYLTDQWYVNAKELAKPAIAAVREGKTNFIPKNWETTYFNWMENIQPWCISRQLWWGHRIPAWYGPMVDRQGYEDASSYKYFVAPSENEALQQAVEFYGSSVEISFLSDKENLDSPIVGTSDGKVISVELAHDLDVLDTWFSSALWPFSTLGWPDKTPELNRYYPTSTLVTGFDIIFFWVARMMMMGLHFMPDVPFADIYIHRLVRDASGAKMSKSKGNVVDPLGVIDEFGADALRFTLMRAVAPGHDIRLGPQDVENNRNFATKLWNAARFAEMNECSTVEGFDPQSVKLLVNQWIITQLGDALGKIEMALGDYRFNDAAAGIYQFVWNFYCDWYLELTKPILLGFDETAKKETRATVAYVRDEILKILHPFMPFITEELWCVTTPSRSEPILALAAWPNMQPHFANAHEEVGWFIELVSAVRSVRTEMNVPASSLVQIEFINPSETTRKRAELWDTAFNRLGRISGSVVSDKVRPGSVQIIVGGESIAIPLQGLIDIAAERARLAKELAKAYADIARVDAKLGNEKFVANAPEEIIEGEREKREEAVGRKGKIAEALDRLKGAT